MKSTDIKISLTATLQNAWETVWLKEFLCSEDQARVWIQIEQPNRWRLRESVWDRIGEILPR